MEMHDIRDKILVAALEHVPFDGWSARTLRAAVDDAGLGAEMAERAFPGGPAELVEHFSDYADRGMLNALEPMGLGAMRIRDRVAAGVRARLDFLAPHKEAARRAVSFLALPRHAALAMQCTYRTVNAIWYAAGDDSTDFNFYTKRGLLAAVYGATVLYWLADDGDEQGDYPATWDFLDRRLVDVLKIPGYQAKLKRRLGALRNPLEGLGRASRVHR